MQLAPTNEIMSAVAFSGMNDADKQNFANDPHGFIFTQANVRVKDNISISLVENTDDVVNLALPYYASFENMRAQKMNEEQLQAVVGGEIFISAIIGACIGAGISIAVGTANAGIGTAIVVAGAVIGASVGMTAVSAGVAGGVNAEHRRNQGHK